MITRAARRDLPPAIRRLNALTPLDDSALEALLFAVQAPRRHRPRYEILTGGDPLRDAKLLLDGWAASICDLPDGRRQILHLLLPGDLIGACDHARARAAASVVALTQVEVCTAPDPAVSPTLADAYAQHRAHERAQLLAQITRLGRMTAQERISHLALELLDRLSFAGLASNDSFTMPLTQEVFGDVLGMTSVHMNRMVQNLRKDGDLIWNGRKMRLPDPGRLRRDTGKVSFAVSAAS